jgi:Protein of unknown function (DUF1646)
MNFAYLINANEIFLHEPIGQQFFNLRADAYRWRRHQHCSWEKIQSALLSLLISGGILIPGNIPNIIAAHALHIKSTEWAKLGIPLGLVIMTFTAVLLLLGLI